MKTLFKAKLISNPLVGLSVEGLTVGKEYEVVDLFKISHADEYFKIINDKGNYESWNRCFFEVVSNNKVILTTRNNSGVFSNIITMEIDKLFKLEKPYKSYILYNGKKERSHLIMIQDIVIGEITMSKEQIITYILVSPCFDESPNVIPNINELLEKFVGKTLTFIN